MFTTDRLIIDAFKEKDIEAFYLYRRKEDVSEFQSWDDYTMENAKHRIEYCIKHPFTKLSKNCQLAIRLKNGTLIGDVYLEPTTFSSITIGYTINSTYWNNGYGYEFLGSLLEWLKVQYKYRVVHCHVYVENVRSIQLLKKYNFIEYRRSMYLGDISFKKNL